MAGACSQEVLAAVLWSARGGFGGGVLLCVDLVDGFLLLLDLRLIWSFSPWWLDLAAVSIRGCPVDFDSVSCGGRDFTYRFFLWLGGRQVRR